MATEIHFGTSGWRAVMADEFTFANVRRAVTGIAGYVVSQKPTGARVIVGRDPRFLGETFCAMADEILIAHGITPLLIADPAPTPAISHAVIREKADGAINFTASHNPPEYNGIKFSTPDGAPALPEVTKRIEAEILASDAEQEKTTPAPKTVTVQALEPRGAYLARLREIIDFKAIHKAICGWSSIPSGGQPEVIPTRCCARPVWTSPRSTIAATCSSAATPPSLTTTCSKAAANKCE